MFEHIRGAENNHAPTREFFIREAKFFPFRGQGFDGQGFEENPPNTRGTHAMAVQIVFRTHGVGKPTRDALFLWELEIPKKKIDPEEDSSGKQCTRGVPHFFQIFLPILFQGISNSFVYFFEINGAEKEGFPSCFQRKHDHFKSYKASGDPIFNSCEKKSPLKGN